MLRPCLGCKRGWAAFSPGSLKLRLPTESPCPSLSPDVGVCSFARFSGKFSQVGPNDLDPGLLEEAANGPETPLQDTGRSHCFSALGVVQCCKVGMGDRKRVGGWAAMDVSSGEGHSGLWLSLLPGQLYCPVLSRKRSVLHFTE